MPLQLNDKHCLLWIKDPSISPFENNLLRKFRKDILKNEKEENPKSFLNRIKRKCFFNSTLREKIVKQIKEYQSIGPIRLYMLNDKITKITEYRYKRKPFTKEECEQWASNHLINPRTNKSIKIGGSIYIELIYCAIQLGIRIPSILNDEPTSDIDEKSRELIMKMKNIVTNVRYRFKFMLETDELFLLHDITAFDKELKIESPKAPNAQRRKPTVVTAKNPFGVSISSSSNSLNEAEKRKLRDKMLEDNEEEKLVLEYQRKNIIQRMKKSLSSKKEGYKSIFMVFTEFLGVLQNDVMNKTDLMTAILKNATNDAKAHLKASIDSFLRNRKRYSKARIKAFKKSYYLDTEEGIIRNLIGNIYEQLLDPSFYLSTDMEIACLSYTNKENFFNKSELIWKIKRELFAYIDRYDFAKYEEIKRYLKYIVEDIIPRDFVKKRELDVREIIWMRINVISLKSISYYQNFYYKMIFSIQEEPKKLRLPPGKGLLMGKLLTKRIEALDEPYFNTNYEDRVITDDNPLNGFTYKECKNWTLMPNINPRTFKSILIDSPIYNRLLCMSYQYDTALIPRMMTSRGYHILIAFTEVMTSILDELRELPQSRVQLENYVKGMEAKYKIEREKRVAMGAKDTEDAKSIIIGLKWKNVGSKRPKGGVEIVNDKMAASFVKSISLRSGLSRSEEPSFYVSFSEEELVKFGITTSITKNSYIEIASYYIPVVISTSKSIIGLKWKRIGARQTNESKEAIERDGVKIVNKKLILALQTATLQKLKDTKGKSPSPAQSQAPALPALPASPVVFSEEDLADFGIATSIAKNSYVKLTTYYMPIVEKSTSDIIVKPRTHVDIKKRAVNYLAHKYYTVGDCLRWAHQPNKDPKNPEIIITTDSPEYNRIFEIALVYDYNIVPVNITKRGIRFMNSIIEMKQLLLTTAYPMNRGASKGKDINQINTKVCNAIKNIYDDDSSEEGKNYKKFKGFMIKICEYYNTPAPLCIVDLQTTISNAFEFDPDHEEEYNIQYYQESALASLLIKYENNVARKLYKEEYRDLFIHDFKKFHIHTYRLDENLKEVRTDAIDGGGPNREFFTKLFDELFCDNTHQTRPFICPEDIEGGEGGEGGGIYYINPNFAPDENFRKIIDTYRKKNIHFNPDFKTERDYEYIYFVIGKLLCLAVYNEEIGLPGQLSTYILAGLIKHPKDFTQYDILYFYLKDFSNSVSYINMINGSQIGYLEYVGFSFNDLYIVSTAEGTSQNSGGININRGNFIKFILQQSQHVIKKNFLTKRKANSGKNMKRRYDSLFAGFSNELRKHLYKKKVSIEQLKKLITNESLTDAILQEFVRNIKVKIEVRYLSESDPAYDPDNKMSNEEKLARENELKGYLSNIITQPRDGVSLEKHYEFVKDLLRFWSGRNYYNKNITYKIFYKYGVGIDVTNLPEAHTCFYSIDMYGFPDKIRVESPPSSSSSSKKGTSLSPSPSSSSSSPSSPVMRDMTPDEKEKYIYDKLIWAVGEVEMVMP